MKLATYKKICRNHIQGKETNWGGWRYKVQWHPMIGANMVIRCQKGKDNWEWWEIIPEEAWEV